MATPSYTPSELREIRLLSSLDMTPGSRNVGYRSGTVQFALDNVIQHSARVADSETTRLDTTYSRRTNNSHVLLTGCSIEGLSSETRARLGNDTNRLDLVRVLENFHHRGVDGSK